MYIFVVSLQVISIGMRVYFHKLDFDVYMDSYI